MPPATYDDSLTNADDSIELIKAAEKKRGRQELGAASLDKDGDESVVTRRRGKKDLLSDDDADDSESKSADKSSRDSKEPRRKPKSAPARLVEKLGMMTRGIHVGLDGAHVLGGGVRRLGPWGIAAVVLALSVVVGSVCALVMAPAPMPVGKLRVEYLSGPQLPERDVRTWLSHFPHRDKLKTGEPWVLEELATYLARLPAVEVVDRVEALHELLPDGSDVLVRTLVIRFGLRSPEMPAVLATGERVWLDKDGRVLPGTMPSPGVRRPVVRDLERGGIEAVREAMSMWRELETKLEPQLVTDIRCDDTLDDTGNQRGIVLYTRQGTRLIWGRPGESRYGVRPSDKVNDVVRTIRCQGDLRRIAVINVRFGSPFFTLRSQSPVMQQVLPETAPLKVVPIKAGPAKVNPVKANPAKAGPTKSAPSLPSTPQATKVRPANPIIKPNPKKPKVATTVGAAPVASL